LQSILALAELQGDLVMRARAHPIVSRTFTNDWDETAHPLSTPKSGSQSARCGEPGKLEWVRSLY